MQLLCFRWCSHCTSNFKERVAGTLIMDQIVWDCYKDPCTSIPDTPAVIEGFGITQAPEKF